MGDSLLYKLRSGKPPKIFFFLKGYFVDCVCRLVFLGYVESAIWHR